MKMIPQATVEAAWERMCDMSEAELRDLATRMEREQPALMARLLDVEQAEQDSHDPGWLLELGAFAWWVMSAESRSLPCPTEAQLQAAEERNARALEALDGLSEKEWLAAARKLIKDCRQAPLLGLAIEVLISEGEEEPSPAGNEVGLGVLHLKTIIDCLDPE